MAKKKLIKIDCPSCCSGNRWHDINLEDYRCEDCDAILNLSTQINVGDLLKSCIFCGGIEFFYEYPFGIPLFRKSIVCYICETEYIGFEYDPSKKLMKYNRQKANEISNTETYLKWHNYWKRFNDEL